MKKKDTQDTQDTVARTWRWDGVRGALRGEGGAGGGLMRVGARLGDAMLCGRTLWPSLWPRCGLAVASLWRLNTALFANGRLMAKTRG